MSAHLKGNPEIVLNCPNSDGIKELRTVESTREIDMEMAAFITKAYQERKDAGLPVDPLIVGAVHRKHLDQFGKPVRRWFNLSSAIIYNSNGQAVSPKFKHVYGGGLSNAEALHSGQWRLETIEEEKQHREDDKAETAQEARRRKLEKTAFGSGQDVLDELGIKLNAQPVGKSKRTADAQ